MNSAASAYCGHLDIRHVTLCETLTDLKVAEQSVANAVRLLDSDGHNAAGCQVLRSIHGLMAASFR